MVRIPLSTAPASVIITALTGLSYNNESTIEDILKNGPIQWISHIGYKDKRLSIKIPLVYYT